MDRFEDYDARLHHTESLKKTTQYCVRVGNLPVLLHASYYTLIHLFLKEGLIIGFGSLHHGLDILIVGVATIVC